MLDKLEQLASELKQLETQLSDPLIINDHTRHKQLGQRYRELQPIITLYTAYKGVLADLESAQELQKEGDDVDLAAEIAVLKTKQADLEQKLKVALLPPDPHAQRNIIVELRAGTGGEESALFAADLYRLYQRYADRQGWQVELISTSHSETGGFKEIIFMIKGEGAFGALQYEGGVHRVQRIPITEAKGRIHTSTVTCAVLPEAEEVDIEIKPEDLRIDVFRAGGAGGQHVNKTESAVRITHLPTGLVAFCQDERSQAKNKQKAMGVLRSRLLAASQEKAQTAEGNLRRSQIKTGERNEKIRTYNYPQNRLTDHRIKKSWNNLTMIMEGDLGDVVEALRSAERLEKLTGH